MPRTMPHDLPPTLSPRRLRSMTPRRAARGLVAAAIVAAASVTLAPRPADACSIVTSDRLVLDPAYADDTVAPGPTTVATPEVVRYPANEGCTGLDCSPNFVVLRPLASDDRAPAARLGFRLRVIGGELPHDLWIGPEPLVPDGAGEVYLYFSDDDRGFAFQLEVQAVDLNGNAGPPVIVTVVGPAVDDGGCSTGGARGATGLGLVALAGLVASRGRRRGRRG
jgi:hypothetical protein